MDVNNVQNFRCVIAEGFLNQVGENLDSTSHNVGCLLVNLLCLINNSSIHFIDDFVKILVVIVKAEFILCHVKTFGQNLIGETERFTIALNNLIFDDQLSV